MCWGWPKWGRRSIDAELRFVSTPSPPARFNPPNPPRRRYNEDAPMVTMRQILEVTDRIVEHFKPHKVILFGSRAYGRPTRDSDVDFLVIMPYQGHPIDFEVRILTTVDPPFPVDLVVCRPGEAARRYREFDPLLRHAFDRGKVLYKREPQGMDRQSRRRLRSRDNANSRTQASQQRRRVLSRAAVR